MLLWKFPPEHQDFLVKIALDHLGKVIRKNEFHHSVIYTLKARATTPEYLVAKAPKTPLEFDSEQTGKAILRMLKEIETIYKIHHHPLIHRFHGIEVVYGIPFLMSTKRDMNLRDLVEEGPLGIVEVLNIAIQVAHGLEFMQSKGFKCHQDLKAENIFIEALTGKFRDIPYKYRARLADFDMVDIAIIFKQPYGSRPYQAAEQYQKEGKTKYDKIDVFALGVNIIEMLTGGLHPLGVRTTDMWPKSSIGKKWNREDPWKKWARDPNVSEELGLDHQSPLLMLILEFFNPILDERPNISEAKSRLLSILKQQDELSYENLVLHLNWYDSQTSLSEREGWPYMNYLVKKVREHINLD